ncbi:testis-specific serine/threonine-protein kinase 6-like [Salminus brasiliensis]|uniref:testis-specific serine/threonine-protein kinase 6-like n=1 Tax=Salminus brasiliensis TaxID=930266 RepID=UPI003B8313D4
MATDVILRSLGFKVLQNIGEGSYSEVLLATSERYPNPVAIKIITFIGKSPKYNCKFLPRELSILRTVKHPHIVQVHEMITRAGLQVIVMEPAATDLYRKIVELGHIPMDQAKMWFSQLLSAVAYLHQQDIVHRDLKCENVLLTADGQVKLTDFGNGRFYNGLPELSETYCCTPKYTAPEVLLNEPYDPKKSDVWSLGVILYTMVTGSMPFDCFLTRSLPSLQRKAVKYPDEIPVEESCRSIISYMLQYKPATRPSVTDVAQHPWLQSGQECERGEMADSSLAEAGSSAFGAPEKPCGRCSEDRKQQQRQHSADVDGAKEDLEKTGLSTSYSLYSSLTNTDEQNDIKHLEKVRVIGRFTVTAVDDEDGGSSSHRDVHPLQDEDSSRAGAGLTGLSVEAVGEECGCFGCSPFCAAVKTAAKAVAAPIIRASQSLRGRMKKFFISAAHTSSSPSQQGARHSAASTEAPAGSGSEQRCEAGTLDVLPRGPVVEAEAVLPQPTVRQGTRKLRFKILKKTKRVHPL